MQGFFCGGYLEILAFRHFGIGIGIGVGIGVQI